MHAPTETQGTTTLAPTKVELCWRKMRPKTTHDHIQDNLWGLEVRTGAKVLKICCAILAFVVLAFWINLRGERAFSNPEAMESAQLARHLAAWKGYMTYSIRPAALGLLQRADPLHAPEVLQKPVPDLSIAPGYPFLLGCLMKALPFNFSATRGPLWSFQPELLIVAFNELIFLGAVVFLFVLARRLFDAEVAWVSAIIFAGSEIYWKFSVSGLSTMWLLLISLALMWCLMVLVQRECSEDDVDSGGALALAAIVGGLVGVGGLSRYAFAWMIVPVLLFIGFYCSSRRKNLILTTLAAFLVVMAPWITRNLKLSHSPFGTAGYALLENARPLEEDRAERCFDPFAAGLSLLTPHDLLNKLLINGGKIIGSDLPRLGGNWVWSFFLCSLLLPMRRPGLRQLRTFLLWSLGLMAVVQALGQTHLSAESPEINSENLLVLLAPLVLIFGTAFFITLRDQLALPNMQLPGTIAGLFVIIICAPFLFDLASPPDRPFYSPYSPLQVQRTAAMMEPEELMMSDIPWAVAWYGDRPCAWLTLNASSNFDELDDLKPVQALYLTQRTTDRPFLSQVLDNRQGWDRFVLNSLPDADLPHGEVPADFPLTKSPKGFAPAQLFLTDKVRWKTMPRMEARVP